MFCFNKNGNEHFTSSLSRTLILDLNSGEITPKVIKSNGYTITINGPGEATLTKD